MTSDEEESTVVIERASVMYIHVCTLMYICTQSRPASAASVTAYMYIPLQSC